MHDLLVERGTDGRRKRKLACGLRTPSKQGLGSGRRGHLSAIVVQFGGASCPALTISAVLKEHLATTDSPPDASASISLRLRKRYRHANFIIS